MIKVGFKLFGCFSVFFFFLIAGTFMAIMTTPPVYHVPEEISKGVFPVAREHVKTQFQDFLQSTMLAEDVGKLEFSEIELNAYLHWFLTEKISPGGLKLFSDPYLMIEPGRIRIRVDVPLKAIFKVAGDRMAGKDLKTSVNGMGESGVKDTDGRIAITLVVRLYWVDKEQKPYVYFDRLYIGVLPIVFPAIMNDLQDQLNNAMDDAFSKLYSFSPVYFRKMNVVDKGLLFLTELKVTDEVAARKKVDLFKKQNPGLVADNRCLYGCTKKEKEELEKRMNEINGKRIVEIKPDEVNYFKVTSELMEERKNKYRDMDIHQKGIDWRKVRQSDPNRDWKFRNFPEYIEDGGQ